MITRLAVAPGLTSPDVWVTWALRYLMLAGLSTALGGLAGRGLARQFKGRAPAALPGPWALRGCLLGAAGCAGLAALAAVAGPVPVSPPAGGAVVIALVELAAFVAGAACARLRRPGWTVVFLLVVVAAEGVRAHPEHIVPFLGAVLSYCHLTPAVMWAGMLLYTLRVARAWRDYPVPMRAVVRLYANAAVFLLLWVAATGVVSALLLVPLHSLLTSGYGRVLILKAVLVAVVTVLAVAGRAWLASRPERGAGPALATRVECGALAAVLAVTALLTALTPPRKPITFGGSGAAHAVRAVPARGAAGGVPARGAAGGVPGPAFAHARATVPAGERLGSRD